MKSPLQKGSSQKPELKKTLYCVPPAVFVPVALGTFGIWLAWSNNSLWPLVALPFIFWGSICAAPNFNLADGFTALVATLLGFAVMHFHTEIGSAIFAGSFSSWFLSCVEKAIRAFPVDDEPRT